MKILSLKPAGLPYIGIFTTPTLVTHDLTFDLSDDSYESLHNIPLPHYKPMN